MSTSILMGGQGGRLISRYNQNYYCIISEVLVNYSASELKIQFSVNGDMSLGPLQNSNSSRLFYVHRQTVPMLREEIISTSDTNIQGWHVYKLQQFVAGGIYEYSYGESGYSEVAIFKFPPMEELEDKVVEEKKSLAKNNEIKDCSLRATFGPLLQNSKFSDVLFIVGEKQIPAHRLILSRASPYFETMLYPRFGDGKFDVTLTKLPLQVEIKNVDVDAFESMLKLVYTDQIDVTPTNVQNLMKIASKYNIPKLQGACMSFMEQGITVDTALEVFEMAPKIFGDKNFGLTFIGEHIRTLVKKPAFLKLSQERLSTILKSDGLVCDELTLFDAVVAWADAKLEEKKTETLTKQELLKDLILHIRFPLLDVGTLATRVSPSGVLTQLQLVNLFAYASVTDEKARSLLPNPGFSPSPRLGGANLIELKLFTKITSPGLFKSITCATPESIKDAQQKGYQFVRTEAYIFRSPIPDTIALELYYKENIQSYYVTTRGTNPTTQKKESRLSGYNFIRNEGYVYEKSKENLLSLTTYVHTKGKDKRLCGHPQTVKEVLISGYSNLRIEGYAVTKLSSS